MYLFIAFCVLFQLKKEAIVGHQTVDTRQVSAEEDNLPTVTDSTIKHKGIVEDEGEAADGTVAINLFYYYASKKGTLLNICPACFNPLQTGSPVELHFQLAIFVQLFHKCKNKIYGARVREFKLLQTVIDT